MYRSEYESLKAMHSACPGVCADPIGWGQYASDPDVWFLLVPFIDMYEEQPDAETLTPKLAEIHRNGLSPNDLYGFPIPVSGGAPPLILAQSTSWEDYFARYMRSYLLAEKFVQGERPAEMERLVGILFNRIIPRLIRPLETGPRSIKPRLLHTDLWSGNRAVNETGDPVIFDPSCIYGHNEFDLGIFSVPRDSYGYVFLETYHRHFVSLRSQSMLSM